MSTTRIQSHVAPAVIALLLLFQVSPVAADQSRDDGDKDRRSVEITFTKWVTTFPRMAGFTGGDVIGEFAGEVLQRQVSLDGRVIRLEAVYEIQNGNQSFTALIRGGTSGETGAALLDGVILAGWRTGARVHVAFQVTANCAGAPDARTCFQGTISISPDSKE